MTMHEGYGSVTRGEEEASVVKVRRQAYRSRRGSSFMVYKTFLAEFRNSKGGSLVVLLGFLTALGIGSLIGVIPQVATQRYAEILYAYDAEGGLCNSFASNKPLACLQGAEHAQTVASYAALARYLAALLSNSVAGSYADVHGRRDIQILSLFFLSLSPVAFLLIQTYHSLNPTWFFAAESLSSIIHILSIGFTQLSDVISHKHRAAAYGLFFGSFMGGIAIAPFFAAVMSHLHIAIFSSCVRISALLIAIFLLPETLPLEKRIEAAESIMNQDGAHDIKIDEAFSVAQIGEIVWRPFRDMAILLRSKQLILLSIGAFLSKMVFSGDIILFFFYVENNLGVTDRDVAGMMFVTGMFGVMIQAVLLKYLISLLGERRLLIVSFCSGTIHNLIYGFAPVKWLLYFGLCLSQLTNTNNPLLSSLASKCVADTEQGRIQGALFSLTSLAEAIGPVCFNYVYHNFRFAGPGTMFVLGTFLYSLGLFAVSFTAPKRSETIDDDYEEDADGTSLLP